MGTLRACVEPRFEGRDIRVWPGHEHLHRPVFEIPDRAVQAQVQSGLQRKVTVPDTLNPALDDPATPGGWSWLAVPVAG